MTRAKATEAIRKIMEQCEGTPVAIVALIASEDDDRVRTMHTLLSDQMCAELFREVATQLDKGDA